MRERPPRFSNERKRERVARIAVPATGTLAVSRWQGALPDEAQQTGDPDADLVEGHFGLVAADGFSIHRWPDRLYGEPVAGRRQERNQRRGAR